MMGAGRDITQVFESYHGLEISKYVFLHCLEPNFFINVVGLKEGILDEEFIHSVTSCIMGCKRREGAWRGSERNSRQKVQFGDVPFY